MRTRTTGQSSSILAFWHYHYIIWVAAFHFLHFNISLFKNNDPKVMSLWRHNKKIIINTHYLIGKKISNSKFIIFLTLRVVSSQWWCSIFERSAVRRRRYSTETGRRTRTATERFFSLTVFAAFWQRLATFSWLFRVSGLLFLSHKYRG